MSRRSARKKGKEERKAPEKKGKQEKNKFNKNAERAVEEKDKKKKIHIVIVHLHFLVEFLILRFLDQQ